MSGEGVVIEDQDAGRTTTIEMPDSRHVVDTDFPRESETPLDKDKCVEQDNNSEAPLDKDKGVEQDKDCVGPSTGAESSGEDTKVSDDGPYGDHETSAVDDFAEPDDELRNKIIKQAEFYFSDVNIVKDSYLLKHVRRNKNGYVSLRLVASFKKMKSLTKDIRAVIFSLRQSEELEVNEEGTKIRRRKPMPQYDETTPSRTVVAVNLEQKNPTVDSVEKEFSKCRGIALIRVLRPGQTVPSDVNKYANQHREIGTSVVAVIEFEKEEQARQACKMMTNTEDWRNGRRVVLLTNQKVKKEKQDSKNENGTSPEDGGGKGPKKKTARGKQKTGGDHRPAEKTSSGSSSGSDGDGSASPQSHPCNGSVDLKSNRLSPHSSPGSSPHNRHRQHNGTSLADASYQNGVHRQKSHRNAEMSRNKAESSPRETSPSSPWVQRRRRAVQDAKADSSPVTGQGSGDGSSVRNSKFLDMVGVLRQPKGPDGTSGFSGLGRGKPRCNTIA